MNQLIVYENRQVYMFEVTSAEVSGLQSGELTLEETQHRLGIHTDAEEWTGHWLWVCKVMGHDPSTFDTHIDETPLTERERPLLDFLTSYSAEHGSAPSFEEIAERCDQDSLHTVHEQLSNLARKGYIKRSYREGRAIEFPPDK